MMKALLIAAATALVATGGLGTAYVLSAASEPTVQTQTFTHEDVVTYTVPTVTETTPAPPPVTETVTTTVTTTAPPPATTAPPTTSEPPPATTEPPVTTTEPPPPPAGARWFVDVSSGTCLPQADLAYTDAEACTWKGAYLKAASGDTIIVKGGTYGDVTVGPNRAGITAVTYRTAPGESVVTGSIENGRISNAAGASNVTFIGPARSREFRNDTVSNVLVDTWTVNCGGCVGVQTFHIENASNVTVRNSEISNNTDNSLIWANGSNLTFEDNVIHDAGLRNGSGAHTECFYAWSITNLTLKRNRFFHCSVMDVFITGSAVASGGFIENNVFEQPWSSTGVLGDGIAFQFRSGGNPSPDPSNWDFRYNTFGGPLNIGSESPVGAGGLRIVGNDMRAGAPCGKAGAVMHHNAGCGSNVIADAGDPADFPSTDRLGVTRPRGAAPDIGSLEQG